MMAAYLDYNATAPMKPEVLAAMHEALRVGGNPSSVHQWGRNARRMVETARREVAQLVNVRPEQVVFTSGGTEANHLALQGMSVQSIFASAIEHASVVSDRVPVQTLPVTPDGRVDLGALETVLANAPGPKLVAVMLANNETGVIQPVVDVTRIAHGKSVLVHCDAVQALGKIPVDFAVLDVDSMALSAHKIGGPTGVGALILRENIALSPVFTGGGQELRRRAGTENVAGIAGFGVAANLASNDLGRADAWSGWRNQLEARLKSIAPESVIWGEKVLRLPNTSCVSLPGIKAEIQVMALDLAGVGVSAGSACSSGKVGRSHVLAAMGASLVEAESAIRVSMGWNTKAADIDCLIDAWEMLWRRVRLAASAKAA